LFSGSAISADPLRRVSDFNSAWSGKAGSDGLAHHRLNRPWRSPRDPDRPRPRVGPVPTRPSERRRALPCTCRSPGTCEGVGLRRADAPSPSPRLGSSPRSRRPRGTRVRRGHWQGRSPTSALATGRMPFPPLPPGAIPPAANPSRGSGFRDLPDLRLLRQGRQQSRRLMLPNQLTTRSEAAALDAGHDDPTTEPPQRVSGSGVLRRTADSRRPAPAPPRVHRLRTSRVASSQTPMTLHR